MKRSLTEQTVAFAGVIQAGELVRQIATGGQCSQAFARNSIDSLFTPDAESTEAVFGGLSGIRLGLTMTREMATRGSADSQQAMAYASGLLRLALDEGTDQIGADICQQVRAVSCGGTVAGARASGCCTTCAPCQRTGVAGSMRWSTRAACARPSSRGRHTRRRPVARRSGAAPPMRACTTSRTTRRS